MSLYDDIIVDKSSNPADTLKAGTSKAWGASGIKLLQDHLQVRKSQNQGKRDAFGRKIVPSGSFTGMKVKMVDEIIQPQVISLHAKDSKTAGTLLGGSWDVSQEYDPFWPNDYEKIIKERNEKVEKEKAAEKARELELREKERKERLVQPISTMSSRPLVGDYSDDDEDDETPRPAPTRTGAAIAPPSFLTESSPKVEGTAVSSIASNVGVSFVAAKIMSKMGYKQGQGLGKDEQGINAALVVEKTGKMEGKIVIGSQMPEPFKPPAVPEAQSTSDADSITEIMRNPTKVILLKNMVGPGEVDDDLEPEVKEECSKYGEVAKCVIFELPGKPAEEAVRIFVEFKRVESAIKAVVDLNGRFFGGRTVRAGFYDVIRFQKLDLIDR